MDKIVSLETLLFACKVHFDDGTSFTIRKADVRLFQLECGTEFDKDDFYQSLCKAQFEEGYEAGLNILDRSARTEKEIRIKLLTKGYLPEVVDAVCERLKGARLIDDKYIAQRLTSSMIADGKGRYAVIRKLKSRGVSADDSTEALSEINEEDQKQVAFTQAVNLARKYEGVDRRERKAKLSQALSRRGFSWDSIEYALERLENDNAETDN